MITTAHITVEIEYDDNDTDPGSLAKALDEQLDVTHIPGARFVGVSLEDLGLVPRSPAAGAPPDGVPGGGGDA